jgi:copper chaperone NosL
MRRALLLLMTIALLVSTRPAWGDTPDLKGPGPGDRCPVCGMFVSPYPEWISSIFYKDGYQVFFDGCKDMFKYYFNTATYEGGRSAEDIEGVFVTEYYSTRMLPADQVFFISGSDIPGPMGDEFIPVKGDEESREFIRDHGGDKRLILEEITPSDIPE